MAARERSTNSDDPNQPVGDVRRDPEVLFDQVKQFVESQLGERVESAFPVLLGPSGAKKLVLFSPVLLLFFTGLLGLGADGLRTVAVVGLMVMFVAYSMNSRRPVGVVAVTKNEFVLVRTDDRRVEFTSLEGRVPRSTPLPKLRVGRYGISGGPLPFPTQNFWSDVWRYNIENWAAGHTSYYELVSDYIQDSRGAGDEAINFITRSAYLRSIGDVDGLVDSPIDAVYPLRPIHSSSWDTVNGHRYSVLITADTAILVRNKMKRLIVKGETRAPGPSIEATFRSHADLRQELATRNLRVSRVLPWVRDHPQASKV